MTVRVLVVDDEESVRRFAHATLVHGGYAPVLAESGTQAVQLAQSRGPFDLLIIDLIMPDLRGDEVARQMRRLNPELKVLYLTGSSDKLFEDRTTLWDDEAFLEKPTGAHGLLEAVALLLHGHPHRPPEEG